MSSTHYPFTIDSLERDERGMWMAQLTIYGDTVAVDRSQGSWRYTPASVSSWRELEIVYCVALQKRVRQMERAEARGG